MHLHSTATLNTCEGCVEKGWNVPVLSGRRYARLAPDLAASPDFASGMRRPGCRSSRLIGAGAGEECWRRRRLVHRRRGMIAEHGLPWLLFSQECSPSGGNCGLIFPNRVAE
jgi:hypothetical protein